MVQVAVLRKNVELNDPILKRDVSGDTGKKRRRLEVKPSGVRPILQGKLRVGLESKKIVWSGLWGLSSSGIEASFPKTTTKARFHFERTSCAGSSDQIDSLEMLQDGYFSGYFCMHDKPKVEKTPQMARKHFEKDILLRFSPRPVGPNDEIVDVVGSGRNVFGSYIIEGSYNRITTELNCARNYFGTSLRRKPVTPKSTPTNLSHLPPKKSSRVRKPSRKYLELVEQTSLKKKTERKVANSESERLKQIKNMLAQLHSSMFNTYPKLNSVVLSLKEGKYGSSLQILKELGAFELEARKLRGSSARNKKDIITGLDVIRKTIQVLSTAGKLPACIPLNPSLTKVTAVNGNESDSSEKTMDLKNRFELFPSLGNIIKVQEIDPLTDDPAASLPFAMNSPPIVDIRNAFQPGHVFVTGKKSRNGISSVQQKKYNEELNNPLERSNGEETMGESLTGITPIDEVEFCDLTQLDAETLRGLNDFVEFSCPSKGG